MRARVQGTSLSTPSSVAFIRPCTSTLTRPSGSLRWRRISETQPRPYTPSGALGASSPGSRWVTTKTIRSFRSACSTAESEISRETKSGTTCAGNTTRSRTGRSGSTSGMSNGSCSSSGMVGTLSRFGHRPEGPGFFRRAQDPAAGQRLDEDAAVPLAGHARVEDGNDAAVLRGADEAAEALLQGEGGLGHLVAEKSVLALRAHAIDARRHDGFPGRGEGQLVDHHQGERLA